VRINAIVALGNLGATETPMEPFRAMLAETNPDLRQAALFGLGMLVTDQNDRGMIDAIHKALGDPDVNVRNDAVILVRKMRRKESIPLLVPALLKDPEPLVRQNAALALGMMGKDAEGVTPYLIELLKDESNKAVEAAWRALNKIHDKDFDRSYATWRDWYEDELKQHWTCVEHKDVSLPVPGECPKCKRKLERMHKPEPRKFADSGPVPPAGPSSGTGLYVCPDHAEIQTTTPAKCGKANCGKELIPKKADAVIYSCPDHADVLTSTPAKCGRPGCGKDLVPKK
jgi:hypothetical protein